MCSLVTTNSFDPLLLSGTTRSEGKPWCDMKMRLRSDQQQSIFKKVLSNHTSSTQTYILAVWQREESSHRNWEELGLLTSGSEARPISSLDNLHSFSQLTKHTCDQSHTHTGNKTEENKEHTVEILPRSIGSKQNCYHIFFLLNYTSFLLRSDNYLLSSTNTFVLNTLRERKTERERERLTNQMEVLGGNKLSSCRARWVDDLKYVR